MVLRHNPRITAPTWDGLAYFWTRPDRDLYVPVTQTAWWLLARLSPVQEREGLAEPSPALFHVANLLTHAAATVLTFELLRRLRATKPAAAAAAAGAAAGGAVWPAAVGAAVFAVHPLQAETVAYAALLKDALAGAFGAAALLAYVSAVRDRDKPTPPAKLFATATALLVLAMLSKPSAVVVPAMAIAIDLFLLRRPARHVALAGGAWALLAVPVVVIAKLAQPGHQGDYVPLSQRLLIAGDALTFYLGKVLWPANLAFDYGRTPEVVLASTGVYWKAAVALLFAAAIVALWRANRGVAVGMALFVLGVAPVLGLVPFDFQIYSTVGDHYLYLSMVGVAVAAASLCRYDAAWQRAAAGVVVAALAVAAHRQAWTWRSLESVSSQALRVNPQSWASYNNLAAAWIEQGRLPEALTAAERARDMKPEAGVVRDTLSHAHLRLGDAAHAAGDAAASVEHYRSAIEYHPRNALAMINLGSTLAEAGQFDEAIALYERALAVNDQLVEARVGLEAARRAKATSPPTTAPPATGPG